MNSEVGSLEDKIRNFCQISQKKGKAQINRIRFKKGDITRDDNEIQKIMKPHIKFLYSNKMMDTFLDRNDSPKLKK